MICACSPTEPWRSSLSPSRHGALGDCRGAPNPLLMNSANGLPTALYLRRSLSSHEYSMDTSPSSPRPSRAAGRRGFVHKYLFCTIKQTKKTIKANSCRWKRLATVDLSSYGMRFQTVAQTSKADPIGAPQDSAFLPSASGEDGG